MDRVALGNTELQVSRLGLGLVEIGRDTGSDALHKADRVLNSALDAGINLFDTAECYDLSEERVGLTVSHRRHEYILATKVGHVPFGMSGEPWTKKTITSSIDHSLSLMKTDYVDLLQVHAYDSPFPLPDDVLRAVEDARDAGKTRYIGFSQENDQAEWALDIGIFDTLQTAFNVMDQRARYNLFNKAKEKGIGIIAKRPIANAVWGKEHVENYYSNDGVAEQLLARAKLISNFGPLEGIPEDPIEFALGFVLSHEEVGSAIVGTSNPEHMMSNIQIVEKRLPLNQSLIKELHDRYEAVGMDWTSID